MGLPQNSKNLVLLLFLCTAVVDTFGFYLSAQDDICVVAGYACSSDCQTVYQCLGSAPFNQIVREVCDSSIGYFCSANIGKCVSTFATTCAPPGYSFTCTSVGTFPDPYDCAGYHICYGDVNNLDHSSEECETGWLYDPYTTTCKIQASYCDEDPVPRCEKDGQLGALNKNPSIYYVCVTGNNNGSIYPVLYECPHGQVFDLKQLACTESAGTPTDVTQGIPTTEGTPTDVTQGNTDSDNSSTTSENNPTNNYETTGNEEITTEPVTGTQEVTTSPPDNTSQQQTDETQTDIVTGDQTPTENPYETTNPDQTTAESFPVTVTQEEASTGNPTESVTPEENGTTNPDQTTAESFPVTVTQEEASTGNPTESVTPEENGTTNPDQTTAESFPVTVTQEEASTGNPTESVTPEEITTEKPTETATPEEITTKQTVTPIESTTSSSGFSCTEEGTFLDPEDCRSYYECSSDLTATHKTCSLGFYYSDIFNQCVFGLICFE